MLSTDDDCKASDCVREVFLNCKALFAGKTNDESVFSFAGVVADEVCTAGQVDLSLTATDGGLVCDFDESDFCCFLGDFVLDLASLCVNKNKVVLVNLREADDVENVDTDVFISNNVAV